MISDVELCQLLNAKFCHELAGTLGAISNSIEFLSEVDSGMQFKASELVATTSKQAINKLLFFRQAYGVSKYQGEADMHEIKKVIDNFLEQSKHQFVFEPKYLNNTELSIPVIYGKIILCLTLLASNALIYGGDIKLEFHADSDYEIHLIAEGKNLKYDNEKNEILLGSDQYTINTINVHSYFTRRLIESSLGDININHREDAIEYLIKINK